MKKYVITSRLDHNKWLSTHTTVQGAARALRRACKEGDIQWFVAVCEDGELTADTDMVDRMQYYLACNR